MNCCRRCFVFPLVPMGYLQQNQHLMRGCVEDPIPHIFLPSRYSHNSPSSPQGHYPPPLSFFSGDDAENSRSITPPQAPAASAAPLYLRSPKHAPPQDPSLRVTIVGLRIRRGRTRSNTLGPAICQKLTRIFLWLRWFAVSFGENLSLVIEILRVQRGDGSSLMLVVPISYGCVPLRPPSFLVFRPARWIWEGHVGD